MLKFEKEEIEIKYEALEREKISLEDQIEVEYTRNRELVKTVEKISVDNERVIKDLKMKHANYEDLCNEKSDNVLILEFTLKNRDEQIERLKNEISILGNIYFECKECTERFETDGDLDAHKKTMHTDCYACEECNHSAKSKADLKLHNETLHGKFCSDCKCNFAGERKLQEHVCRIHVSNPTSGTLYTKDWFVKDNCVRVFDNETKDEKYVLHCDHCLTIKSCEELPTDYKQKRSSKDPQGRIHLPANVYLKSNTVNWKALGEMTSIINISNMALTSLSLYN